MPPMLGPEGSVILRKVYGFFTAARVGIHFALMSIAILYTRLTSAPIEPI